MKVPMWRISWIDRGYTEERIFFTSKAAEDAFLDKSLDPAYNNVEVYFSMADTDTWGWTNITER